MTCSSSYCIAALLAGLGPEAEPVGLQPAGPDAEEVEVLIEGMDPATRSVRLYSQAVENAERGRYDDASAQIVKAYAVLPEQMRFSDSGLLLLTEGTDYHLQAYRQTNDETLLANIHPLLEEFLEHYQGLDPRIEGLKRKLKMIRDMRLSVSDQYFRERKFTNAAIKARDCYRALQAVDKGGAIGEQAALAASRAYAQAWYIDGDIRHIKAAIELVADHLAKAGEDASRKAKQERARLGRNLKIAEARGGGIDQEEDLGGMAPQDRSFLIASGAALGAGVVLSAGAAAVAASSFEADDVYLDVSYSIRGQPEHIATAIPLGVVGGVVAGLAIHSMVDTGFIPPRERKILALGATAAGLLGMVVGSTLLAVGATRWDDLRSTQARGLENAGFSILVGMGAPLGAGIAALVSRQAGGR
jgi:hypothetical protein